MKNVFILIIISIIFYALWRMGSPYPSTLNWDIWEHQTVINAIRLGSVAWLPSQLSDTFRFDGYTTAFHMLLAGLQSILNTQNIPGFWWIAEGIFFALTTLATYAFVYALTKNKLTAMVAGILSAGFFESAVAFTTLFLLPQTVAALLWVIGLTILILQKSKREKLIVAFITSLIILPFHAIVGGLGAAFLFLMALELNIHWALVLVASYVIPAYIASRFGLAGLNAGEAQSFNQSLPEKLALLRQWYGYLPVPFLFLGLKKANRAIVIFFAVSAGLLASPFPYVLKFIVIIRYIMIAVIAIGVGEFLLLMKSNIARYISLIALTMAAGVIFIANTTVWKNPVVLRGTASHVSQDEVKAATFLKNHYETDTVFLISDPATQYILEPLTGIDTQGGAYMNAQTRRQLLTALNSDNAGAFRAVMSQITHDRILLAVSARTMKWLAADPADRMSIAYNIWRPDGLSMNDEITIHDWKTRFSLTEIYKNPGIVIFEMGAPL